MKAIVAHRDLGCFASTAFAPQADGHRSLHRSAACSGTRSSNQRLLLFQMGANEEV